MPESIGDLLLYSVSARREVNWQSFCETFDEVYLRQAGAQREGESIRYRRRAAVSTLDSLAHVDFDGSSDGARVYAAPAVLAALPTAGLARAILCGARSPSAAEQVSRVAHQLSARLALRPASSPYATAVVEVEATSRASLDGLARELNVAYAYPPPAISIMAASGSLDEYLAGLQWTRERELDWPRIDFDVVSCEFRGGETKGPLRLTRYVDPLRQVPRFRLWRGDEGAEVDPRWARYATMRSAGTVGISYDHQRGTVRVPRSCPLPRLLSRALVLCSGAPAETVRLEGGPIGMFDLYRGVPPDLFAALRAKLGSVEDSRAERQ